jgi:hypothetical protein
MVIPRGKTVLMVLGVGMLLLGAMLYSDPGPVQGSLTVTGTTGTFTGQVHDSGGLTIGGCKVVATLSGTPPVPPRPTSIVDPSPTTVTTYTDVNGRYSMVVPTSTLEYIITASLGRFSATRTAYMPDAGPRTVNIVMDIEQYSVKIIVEAGGQVSYAAIVKLYVGGQAARTMSTFGGFALFLGVPPCTASLTVELQSYSSYVNNAFVVPKQNVEKTISMDLAPRPTPPTPTPPTPTPPTTTNGTISGKVSDDHGQGVDGALLSFTSNGRVISVATKEDGSYMIQLPPGTYSVIATAQRYNVSEPSTVSVSSNAGTTLDIVLHSEWKPNSGEDYTTTALAVIAATVAIGLILIYFAVRRF